MKLLWSGDRVRDDAPIEVFGELRIGREAAATDYVLSDRYVSRQHAIVVCEPNARSARLRNLSSGGSFIGTSRVDDEDRLRDGEVFSIGRSLLIFRFEPVPLEDDPRVTSLLGGAPAMRALRARIASVADHDGVVFVRGETGAGKDLVARCVHELSGRAGSFVEVSCAALTDTGADALLFGASGSLAAAAGGTLFLDEIGDLPALQQATLARALSTGRFTPLGSMGEVPHEARVIAATYRPLTADAQDGRFRPDLYSALTETTLDLPPLRHRREDVLPLLAHAFGNAPVPPLDYELAKALLLHPWPLNVREISRIATHLAEHGRTKRELTLDLVRTPLTRMANIAPELGKTGDSLKQTMLEPPTRGRLETLLREHRGVVADVARRLGRSRKEVHTWIQQHGIVLDDPHER